MASAISTVNLEPNYIQIKELTERKGDPGSFNAGVYLVRRRGDGRHFAQKKLQPTVPLSWIKNEIRIIQGLRHRNILKYVESFITREPYAASIYTQWCDLGSLDDLIRAHRKSNRPIPEGFVRHVFISLADALAYCHYGITETDVKQVSVTFKKPGWLTVIHRDLKPGNVFLVSSRGMYPRVIIGDFGMSIREDDRDYRRKDHAGAWMVRPPDAKCSPKSDIWALGVIMQMLCRLNYGPLKDRPKVLAMTKWIHSRDAFDRTAAGENFSDALNLAVESCLSFSPEDRLTAAQLTIALRTAFKVEPVDKQPLPRWANGWRIE